MKKKLLSLALVVAMVSTIGTMTAVNTSAEETKDTRGTIYFDSTDLYGATKDGVMYCYTWSDTEGGLFAWDTAGCKMTNIGDFLYSYDVPTKNLDGVAVDANLMIFHARDGKQTYDLTFDDSCMGDTAYVSGDYYGCFPINSEFCLPMCSWSRNSSKGGAHITIDSTGRIQGVSLTKNETPESVVDEFIADYKEGMEEGKAGYDNPELITEENRNNLIAEINKILAENSEEPVEPPTEGPTEPDDDTTAGPYPWDTYWFEIPDFWKVEDDIYYVELWNNGNEDIYGWETEKYRIDFEEGNDSRGYIYSYLWDDDDQWDMMCISNSAGKKTLNAVFNRSDIGGVFTIKESNYKSLSNETFYEVVFNEEDCRTQRKIYFGDSIGVIGEEHTSNESDQSIFDSFCIKYGPSSDGTCYWNEAMSEKYNMNWEEAKEYVKSLLDIEDIDLAERYGLKRGLPLPENVKLPERYTNKDKFMEAGGSTDWDGYYDVYYFEAPDSWVNENKDKKEPGFEIGFYWYCGAVSEPWPGVPAKKLSVLDENGNDIYADKNIYYGIAPTFATSIIWNNGIGDTIAENKEFKLQTKDIKVDDPMSNSLSDLWYEYNPIFDGADISGCLAYIPDSNTQARCPLNPEYDVFDVEWMYFDPRTGETTTEPLHDLLSGFLTRPDFYWGYDKVLLNPYYDMDYTYSSEVSEKPTEESTEAKTEAPTEKPTSTSTTATTATSNATNAPTNASTNTAKGTVNTSQTAPLTALVITFVASLGVVLCVNKKRNSHNS
ncbi:MAG: hypothetical protein UHK60_05240 [Acutalibacteraceae bacterium]|nr:hypothetical protein [Acutalibacteraceae bacterium]